VDYKVFIAIEKRALRMNWLAQDIDPEYHTLVLRDVNLNREELLMFLMRLLRGTGVIGMDIKEINE